MKKTIWTSKQNLWLVLQRHWNKSNITVAVYRMQVTYSWSSCRQHSSSFRHVHWLHWLHWLHDYMTTWLQDYIKHRIKKNALHQACTHFSFIDILAFHRMRFASEQRVVHKRTVSSILFINILSYFRGASTPLRRCYALII